MRKRNLRLKNSSSKLSTRWEKNIAQEVFKTENFSINLYLFTAYVLSVFDLSIPVWVCPKHKFKAVFSVFKSIAKGLSINLSTVTRYYFCRMKHIPYASSKRNTLQESSEPEIAKIQVRNGQFFTKRLEITRSL